MLQRGLTKIPSAAGEARGVGERRARGEQRLVDRDFVGKRQVAGTASAAATVNAAGGEFEIDIRQGQDDAAFEVGAGQLHPPPDVRQAQGKNVGAAAELSLDRVGGELAGVGDQREFLANTSP